jgi:hypothetical protein
MKIAAKHPTYPRHAVRRATLWAAKQIGLESKHRQPLTIEVGYRRNIRGHGSWGGWYKHAERLVQVLLPRGPMGYPTYMAHGKAERVQGRDAHDEWELFVAILAHELEHARAYAVARNWEERARLNHEGRVRAVDHRVLLLFREARDTLIAEWTQPVAEFTPVEPLKPTPSAVDRRAERAAKLLAQWERRLKMAQTKVKKYRRKVGYYSKAAAKRKA